MNAKVFYDQLPNGALVGEMVDHGTMLVLPYPISSNRYWRPVKLGSHISIVPTKEAKQYRHDVAMLAKAAGVKPINGRVYLSIKLYPHRPQDWLKRARLSPDAWDDTVQCIDLGNCEKVLSDALNGIAWHDDKQHRKIILERMTPDEHGARVVVEFWSDPTPATAPELPL